MDNRKSNLRIVTICENMQNRHKNYGKDNSFYGKTHTTENREKISISRSIPVIQLTIDGVEIRVFKSALEAQHVTGISNSNIIAVIKGKRKSAGGYLWKR